MLDFFMRLLGYEKLENIKIPSEYRIPRSDKLRCKLNFYGATNQFIDKIIINNQNVLLDGYTTHIISRWKNAKYVKVIRVNISVKDYLQNYKGYRIQKDTQKSKKGRLNYK